MNINKIYIMIVFLVSALVLSGCNSDTTSAFAETFNEDMFKTLDSTLLDRVIESRTAEKLSSQASALEVPAANIDYEKIKPNEMGQIMIIMYHNLAQSKPHPPYQRLAEDFKSDLQRLYDGGFRLVPLSDIANNDIKVEAGYSPVAFVFDDGLSSTFSLTNKDGKLVPTEGCMIDILNKFVDEHPDFGKAGVFALIGAHENFRGDGTIKERLTYLIENGFEIASHTFSHNSLKKMTQEQIQEDIAKMEQYLTDIIPDYKVQFLVYPYGERPQKDLRNFALEGNSYGIEYSYKLGLREGQSGASATPGHIDFDRLNVPRVRGSDNANTDLGWHLRYFTNNPQQRYISDGLPNRISVPASFEKFIDKEALKDKEIYIY